MRGSKPDNSNIHQLAGPIGHRAAKESAPAKPLMDLTPPPRLKGVARETWKRCAQQLLDDQTLTELSRDLFVAYCDAVADYDRARKSLDRRTVRVGKTPNGGSQQIAEVGLANRALERMLKLGEIFAIDPYTRERRGKGAPDKPANDEKDDNLFTPAVG
jgi:phage terminase small subunit